MRVIYPGQGDLMADPGLMRGWDPQNPIMTQPYQYQTAMTPQYNFGQQAQQNRQRQDNTLQNAKRAFDLYQKYQQISAPASSGGYFAGETAASPFISPAAGGAGGTYVGGGSSGLLAGETAGGLFAAPAAASAGSAFSAAPVASAGLPAAGSASLAGTTGGAAAGGAAGAGLVGAGAAGLMMLPVLIAVGHAAKRSREGKAQRKALERQRASDLGMTVPEYKDYEGRKNLKKYRSLYG